ncbi:MAG: IPT/TIG domain-containing protein [Dehalococcoidales bacterium]
MHYDGANWSSEASGVSSDLYGIWGSSANNIYAVGKSGVITHYNGTSWSLETNGISADLHGIWGSDANNIYAVGNSGIITHYDGTGWSAVTSGVNADLYGIWGSGADNIYAIGKSGIITHYNGTSWSLETSGVSTDLYGIWGSGADNIYAVGKSGTVLRYNGTAWSGVASGTAVTLNGIWGIDSSHIFVVGQSGVILSYDGAVFVPMDRNIITELRSLWGSSYYNLVAVGDSGTILKYAPPVISSVTPNEVLQGKTLNVTITGDNFGGTTAITFGAGISVNSFTLIGKTIINVNLTVTSGAVLGSRNITVTTPNGSYTLEAGFKVKQALPSLTSVEPGQGKQGETLNVTVTGNNLTGVTKLDFGSGVTVNNFTELSPNQLIVNISVARDAAGGFRNVAVTTSGGNYTLINGFTVMQAPPVIDSTDPNNARQGETLDVLLSGSDFSNATAFSFGAGISINDFTVNDNNSVNVNITVSPNTDIGVRDVTITTPGGSYTLSNGFTVKQALPEILTVEPNLGRQGETLNLTITGDNFIGANMLYFGIGISVNGFNVLSSHQIAANITVSADAAVGLRDVAVGTSGGTFILADCFTVKQASPLIKSVSPANGNRGSTVSVILNGNNLDGALSVVFGEGITVSEFITISPSQLQVNIVIVPDAETGPRDVSVITAGGSFTLSGGFTVKQELPLITGLSIGSANQGATLNVTITGANFNGTSKVQFGSGIAVNSFNAVTPEQIVVGITVETGAAAGKRDVTITTPGGSSVFAEGFTIKQALPVITSINPDRGEPSTSMTIIVNGSNLAGATSVSFGDRVEIIDFANISPTQLRVNVNIKADALLGPRDIIVTTPGGSTIFGQGFNIELKTRSTAALITIWSAIAVIAVILTIILNVIRRKRASKL